MLRKWSATIRPALASYSIRADDWPGVVWTCDGSGDWRFRVILDRGANCFRLQCFRKGAWETLQRSGSVRPLVQWLVVTLRVSVVNLPPVSPVDLVQALTMVAARLAVPLPAFCRQKVWLLDEYPALSELMDARLVVDPSGRRYAFQVRLGGRSSSFKWVTQATGFTLAEVGQKVLHKTYDPTDPEADVVARFAELCGDLPDCAADGPWPVVPLAEAIVTENHGNVIDVTP